MKYRMWDDHGYEVRFTVPRDVDAVTVAEADLRGRWAEGDATYWVACHLERLSPNPEYLGRVKVAIHPLVPDCDDLWGNVEDSAVLDAFRIPWKAVDFEDGHMWARPHELVGGIERNPGVWASRGGVWMHEVCLRCGIGRIIDTYAQDPEDGEQGLRSIRYERDADVIEAVRQAARASHVEA